MPVIQVTIFGLGPDLSCQLMASPNMVLPGALKPRYRVVCEVTGGVRIFIA
jgi:hypothetical protein